MPMIATKDSRQLPIKNMVSGIGTKCKRLKGLSS